MNFRSWPAVYIWVVNTESLSMCWGGKTTREKCVKNRDYPKALDGTRRAAYYCVHKKMLNLYRISHRSSLMVSQLRTLLWLWL